MAVTLSPRAPLIVFGFLLANACGEQTLSPVAVAQDCPALPDEPAPPSTLVLDDMEDGDTYSDRAALPEGFWNFSNDQTNQELLHEASSRCAASGRFAMHARSSGQTGWGAEMNLFFRNAEPETRAFDARAYNAISFHIATAPGSGSKTMRIGFTTRDTAFDSPVCDPCGDLFGQDITAGPQWRRVVMRFDALKQVGWGRPQGLPFRIDQLVEFRVHLTGAFDVWLDRIAFEKLP